MSASKCRQQINKKWKKNHPEYMKNYLKKYRARNGPSNQTSNFISEYRKMGRCYKVATISRIKCVSHKKNIPFDLTIDDLIIPEYCPILGVKLEVAVGKNGNKDNSPSIDRIIPELGYVKGNIIIISNKANRIKSDSNLDELLKVANFYKNLINKYTYET